MCHLVMLTALPVDDALQWSWMCCMKMLKASHEHAADSEKILMHHMKALMASHGEEVGITCMLTVILSCDNIMANHTCVIWWCWRVYQLMMLCCGLECVAWRCLMHHTNMWLSQGRHRCIIWKHWWHHMTRKLASHARGNVVTQQVCWHLAIRRWHTIIPSSGDADGFTFWWCSIVVLNVSHEDA